MDYDSLVASYVCQVLQLDENDTEEALDERLRNEARSVGLGAESPDSDYNVKQLMDEVAESSPSVSPDTPHHSRASSRSIGTFSINSLASRFSNVSFGRRRPPRQMRPSSTIAPQSSLPICSVEDDSIPRGRPHLQDSQSPSSLTTSSRSTFSPSAESQSESLKSQSQLIKGLSKLVLSRGSSHPSVCDACSLADDGTPTYCQPTRHLSCEHSICDHAIRRIVQDSERNGDVVMRCKCGEIIPQNMIEMAMNEPEHTSAKHAASIFNQWRESTFTWPQSAVPHARVNSLDDDGVLHTTRSEPDAVIVSRDDFKHMRRLQVDQRDRMLSWLEERRAEMNSQLKFVIDKSWQSYVQAVEDLAAQHDTAMSEAEDKQVKAEARMRAVHAKAVRDHATALKYMEPYCAGTYTSGEPHHRVVTPQNRLDLEKKWRTRDEMGPKHTAAINVLRGEQAGRIQDRAHRKDDALQELFLAQQRHRDLCLQEHNQRMANLDKFARERRARIRRRWRLATAVYLKKLEDESQASVDERIPEVEWLPIEASTVRNDSLLQYEEPVPDRTFLT